MPYQYVEPDVLLTHQGVDVFRTYFDGSEYPSEYWFTTDVKSADTCHCHGEAGVFDVRRFARIPDHENVAAWNEWWQPRFHTEDDAIRSLIVAEIDAGRLPKADPAT